MCLILELEVRLVVHYNLQEDPPWECKDFVSDVLD